MYYCSFFGVNFIEKAWEIGFRKTTYSPQRYLDTEGTNESL
jgi:hypothetical protein